MAQFSEVMRQAKRMCESFSDGCRECPISDADELECGITSRHGWIAKRWSAA